LSLEAFVAQAIHGPRNKEEALQPKAIAEGMYLAYLAGGQQAPRFRMARVEFAVCHHCGTEYEREVCPKYGGWRDFNASRTRRIERNRIIGIPSGPPLYQRDSRHRCNGFAEHWRAIERYHGRSGTVAENQLDEDEWHNLYSGQRAAIEALEVELGE